MYIYIVVFDVEIVTEYQISDSRATDIENIFSKP